MSVENDKLPNSVMARSECVRRRKSSDVCIISIAVALLLLISFRASLSQTNVFLDKYGYKVVFVGSEASVRKPDTPLPVYLVPSHNSSYTKGEHYHFISDGISKSPLLRITFNNTDDTSVWIVDMIRSMDPGGCKGFIAPEVEKALLARKEIYGDNVTWPVYFLDWSDHGHYHRRCSDAEILVGADNVHFAKRSIVSGRKVDENTAIVTPGRIHSFDDEVKHMPYAVRTDIVEEIGRILSDEFNVTNYPDESWNLADLERPLDVSHFWPSDYTSHPGGIGANLRFAVSRTIDRMKDEFNITAFVGLSGEAAENGRSFLQPAYVRDLIRHKIVVVCQRDYHEDHYRLMEALAGGALVLTDPMLSLPYGFLEGENIVFYHNMTDLQDKILYYLRNDTARLEIARKGWSEAMSRHRSWHLVEDLLFGEIRTKGMNPVLSNA